MPVPLPPAYPIECERQACTRDGLEYRIRPIRPDDFDRERQFVVGLSEESRFNRLMYTVSGPSDAFLRQLVNIDYRHHMALVAVRDFESGEQFIGVARYVTVNDSARHEFAVAIADEWQGRGIATELLIDLFLHARRHGLKWLYGTVLPANSRMLSLAQRLGLDTQTSEDDASLVIVSKDLQPDGG
jgi:acetyltransferase